MVRLILKLDLMSCKKMVLLLMNKIINGRVIMDNNSNVIINFCYDILQYIFLYMNN